MLNAISLLIPLLMCSVNLLIRQCECKYLKMYLIASYLLKPPICSALKIFAGVVMAGMGINQTGRRNVCKSKCFSVSKSNYVIFHLSPPTLRQRWWWCGWCCWCPFSLSCHNNISIAIKSVNRFNRDGQTARECGRGLLPDSYPPTYLLIYLSRACKYSGWDIIYTCL